MTGSRDAALMFPHVSSDRVTRRLVDLPQEVLSLVNQFSKCRSSLHEPLSWCRHRASPHWSCRLGLPTPRRRHAYDNAFFRSRQASDSWSPSESSRRARAAEHEASVSLMRTGHSHEQRIAYRGSLRAALRAGKTDLSQADQTRLY